MEDNLLKKRVLVKKRSFSKHKRFFVYTEAISANSKYAFCLIENLVSNINFDLFKCYNILLLKFLSIRDIIYSRFFTIPNQYNFCCKAVLVLCIHMPLSFFLCYIMHFLIYVEHFSSVLISLLMSLPFWNDLLFLGILLLISVFILFPSLLSLRVHFYPAIVF